MKKQEKYQSNKTPTKIKVEDWVMIRIPKERLGEILEVRAEGPIKVLEVISGKNVVVGLI